MPGYDGSGYDPPAPVAHVNLRNPDGSHATSEASLLLDTGADVILLPRAAVESLGVAPAGGQRYELVGLDGSRTTVPSVLLDMLFLSRVFRGRYLVTDEKLGILGRDVLNHVALLFGGPRQQRSEQRA